MLYNFVRNGGDAFIGNPEFQELYVDLCKQVGGCLGVGVTPALCSAKPFLTQGRRHHHLQVFTTQRLREDEQWHAGKNMEILILYGHSPQLDEVLPIFVGLAVEKLVVQAPPGLLRVMCMNIVSHALGCLPRLSPSPRVCPAFSPSESSCRRCVFIAQVIAGLYYNPELLLRILEGLPVEGESLTSRFLAFWFRDIEDFTGCVRLVPPAFFPPCVPTALPLIPKSTQNAQPQARHHCALPPSRHHPLCPDCAGCPGG